METYKATIVVVPRDHFSDTKESLESLNAFTDPSCPLVYVDGNSPSGIARYLREQARTRNFKLLRYDHYLTPNQARNVGASHADTRYVVFLDNDVIVSPGWLLPLIDCADSTNAAVVGPLNYEGRPIHRTVHFAGGETRIVDITEDGVPRRHLVDEIHKESIPEGSVLTALAEFHCMLVRTDVFHRLGGLDERVLSTREHIDFCLTVQQAGEQIYFEPRSRITFLPPAPLRLSDVPYFALRWSDLWDAASFQHLQKKWGLEEDTYFVRRYQNLGWRRREVLMCEGLLRWLVSWRVRIAAERLLHPLERRVNNLIARRHARRYGNPSSTS